MVNLTRLEEFFFVSSLEGYAGGGKFLPVSGCPGWKVFRKEEDELLFVDMYFSTRSFSRGMTVIYLLEKKTHLPIWQMSYNGEEKLAGLDTDVKNCLKGALCRAYEQRQFFAGRGPEIFEMPVKSVPMQQLGVGGYQTLVYRNSAAFKNTSLGGNFFVFSARETIRKGHTETKQLLFWHDISGGLLRPDLVVT